MKHLEETPWFICDEDDTNLCAYVDTDSNYFNAEPLLLHLYPDFEQKTNDEKDEILEKVALYYQDYISVIIMIILLEIVLMLQTIDSR
jgi:ferric iron reductase protein FhuF